MLWQNELSTTLSSMNLIQVPEEPCLFRMQDASRMTFVFFYVDDIVILANKKEDINGIKKRLMDKYEMRDLGELNWFLNIHISRDRSQRKPWLSQETHIEKIVKTYNLEHATKANTPLSVQRRDIF